MFSLGISYGATICDIDNISELQNWNAHVLEIPVSDNCKVIIEEAKKYGYFFSLHVPSFELINKHSFIRNFKTEEEILIYVEEIRKSLVNIDGKAEYLVAHYPIRMLSDDINLIKSLNRKFILQIHNIAKEFNIKLFIENVVVNSLYYLPEIYKNVLNYCDGICFDIGHFHTAQALLFNQNSTKNYVDEFFDLYQDDIKCIHLYNSTNKVDGNLDFNRHYPFSEQSSEQGFMDTQYLKNKILNLKNIEYVIHEIHRIEFDSEENYDFNVFGKYQVKEV